MDDILVVNNDMNFLIETKIFLFKKFEMKDLGESSFIIAIEIFWDLSKQLLVILKRL